MWWGNWTVIHTRNAKGRQAAGVLAAGLAVLILGGCASNEDLNALKAEVEASRTSAAESQRAAAAAAAAAQAAAARAEAAEAEARAAREEAAAASERAERVFRSSLNK